MNDWNNRSEGPHQPGRFSAGSSRRFSAALSRYLNQYIKYRNRNTSLPHLIDLPAISVDLGSFNSVTIDCMRAALSLPSFFGGPALHARPPVSRQWPSSNENWFYQKWEPAIGTDLQEMITCNENRISAMTTGYQLWFYYWRIPSDYDQSTMIGLQFLALLSASCKFPSPICGNQPTGNGPVSRVSPLFLASASYVFLPFITFEGFLLSLSGGFFCKARKEASKR